jgi:hypothetical protein
VAILRSDAGRDAHDRELSDLVGEYATRGVPPGAGPPTTSACTRRGQDVNHPIGSELELGFNRLEVSADPA